MTDSLRICVCVTGVCAVLLGYSFGQGGERHAGSSSNKISSPVLSRNADIAIQAAVAQLVADEISRLGEKIEAVNLLLEKGDLVEVKKLLHLIQERQAELESALRWAAALASSEAQTLTLLKVRVMRARPRLEKLGESGNKEGRELSRLMGRLFASDLAIDAEVLEVGCLGSAYRRKTLLGRLAPQERKREITVGGVIELSADGRKLPIGAGNIGQDFWVVITPPIARKALPNIIGSKGASSVELAIRACGA